MENLNNIKGLTEEEVHNRTELGQVNSGSDVKTKSYGQILKDNIFSLFNNI